MQDGRRGAPRPRPRTTLESRVLRKAHARFGEGRMEKCWHRQLASRLLHLVMAFEDHLDAKRVFRALDQRLTRFGLTLHPEKSRFIDFRFRRPGGQRYPATSGTTFDFLGFTPGATHEIAKVDQPLPKSRSGS